jgi:predicted transcriptional regulator
MSMSDDNDLVSMTIEVVASYVAHNSIAPDDVPGFIAKTHAAIKQLNQEPEAPAEVPAPAHEPAVTVRKSLASRDHIISLIDGKPYKTLKRHLAGHGLTPVQYRERYSLKADYPMVAPAYSDHRREVAKTLGLGRKVTGSRGSAIPADAAPAVGTPTVPTAAKRGRKPAASTAEVSAAAGATPPAKPVAPKRASRKAAEVLIAAPETITADAPPSKARATKKASVGKAPAKARAAKPVAEVAAAPEAPTDA